ncbi:hypothetical protein TRICHSKD4_3089 [Roseibium sp. TrichSKD4]|nr:hypothetical protein [Roseibium sp. TrichSKD4]EFO31399.1 hypothetical protein TRICHSKD4_3089 [Roseibium sp. TrichSKD4]
MIKSLDEYRPVSSLSQLEALLEKRTGNRQTSVTSSHTGSIAY